MLTNLRWGIAWGASAAGGYSLVALAIYMIGGSTPFQEIDTTLMNVVGSYWLAGIFGGMVLGLARPLLGGPIAAGIIGFLVAIPAVAALAVMAGDLSEIGKGGVLFLAALFGPVAGVAEWSRSQEAEWRRNHRRRR